MLEIGPDVVAGRIGALIASTAAIIYTREAS